MNGANGQGVKGYERQADDWYVEPAWCVDLLLTVERFAGTVWDPCSGMGTIPDALARHGYSQIVSSDLRDRGYGYSLPCFDFLGQFDLKADSVVMNPPFKMAEAFVDRALSVSRQKVAVLLPLKWLASRTRKERFEGDWPLARLHVLANRPSMPPGEEVLAGKKASGGAVDFGWFVFEHGTVGAPQINWIATPGRARKPSASSRPAPEQALKKATV